MMTRYFQLLIAMLHFSQSTDFSLLFQQFQSVLQQSNANIFDTETVIVPSMALGGFLENELANRQGISTRVHFRFWAMFEWELIERVALGEAQIFQQAPLSSVAMHWKIFAYLHRESLNIIKDDSHPLFESLHSIFVRDQSLSPANIQKLWSLSEAMSDVFVAYIAMRSDDWMKAWSESDAVALDDFIDFSATEDFPDWKRQHYDAILSAQLFIWKTLFADAFMKRESLIGTFAQRLQDDETARRQLPKRVFFFNLFLLTPAMLRFLSVLSEYCEVFVFHHALSNAYINDIVDGKWLKKLYITDADSEDQHFSAGNTLVSRFAKQQRDIARLLADFDLEDEIEKIDTNKAQGNSLLAQLQTGFNELIDYELYFDSHDDSLRIHGCHGIAGQLEVLRGEIVKWLNADDSRHLDDVLIVLPDVEKYRSLLSAIFPAHGDYDGYYLPVRITGVVTTDIDNLWRALSGIYQFLNSRFTYQDVEDYFTNEVVCQSYRVTHGDMQEMLYKLRNAGFRRGIDLAHLKSNSHLEDDDERYTFAYALDRLVAGFIMPEADRYDAAVPYDVGMGQYQALEALCKFYNEMIQVRAELAGYDTADIWIERLQARLNEVFSERSTTQGFQKINQALLDLSFSLKAQQFIDGKKDEANWRLPLDFILQYIESNLAEMQVSSEPTGCITIGRLTALQGIPYKLIAFVGADLDVFPAKSNEQRHNLINIDRKRLGDINQEQSDLFAFMSLLSNAQEAFWCFYSRYEEGDSDAHNPAAPVQELLDYLDSHLSDVGNDEAEHISNTEIAPKMQGIHFVQAPDPFHPDGNSVHPAPLWKKVREKMLQENESFKSFVDIQYEDPGISEKVLIASNSLADQLRDPLSTFLIHHQLATYDRDDERAVIYEPLGLDSALQQWQVRHHAIVENLVPSNQDVFSYLPILPVGVAKPIVSSKFNAEVTAQIKKVKSVLGVNALPTLEEKHIEIDDYLIRVDLPQDKKILFWDLSASKGSFKYIFRYWIRHLLWQIDGGGMSKVVFQGNGGLDYVEYKAVKREAALKQLTAWLRLHSAAELNLCFYDLEALFAKYKSKSSNFSDFNQIDQLNDDWQKVLMGNDALLAKIMANSEVEIRPLFDFMNDHCSKGKLS